MQHALGPDYSQRMCDVCRTAEHRHDTDAQQALRWRFPVAELGEPGRPEGFLSAAPWPDTKRDACNPVQALHDGCIPKLKKFMGRPQEYSPKAMLLNFLGYKLPFDRHDWVVDRCGREVRFAHKSMESPTHEHLLSTRVTAGNRCGFRVCLRNRLAAESVRGTC